MTCLSLLAHVGHHSPSETGLLHFLTDPAHIAWWAAGVLLAGGLWFGWRSLRRRRVGTRSEARR